jgi:hypothetical protein
MNIGHTQITSCPPYFAQILRSQGKVTLEVLDEALRLSARERRYVGQILCELAVLSAADLEAALAIQQAYRLH